MTDTPVARTVVRAAAALLIVAVIVPAWPTVASCAITLTDYPHTLVALDDVVTVTWDEVVTCKLVYGRVPGSYTFSTAATGIRSLSFIPFEEYVAPGIWYCVLDDVSSSDISEEFRLIVESPVFATPTSPRNGSTIEETSTLFEWDPVDGVPYYHVALSDQEIVIEEVGGELTLTGANLIWQALTNETSIQYGSVDPSGYFVETNGTSPPLMSGFSYNWLIFNCYGNDPLLTSVAGAGLAGFTVDVTTGMTGPELLLPPDMVIITDDILDLSWTPVDGASSYHVYIYEKRALGEGEASYPVWDGGTTGNFIEVRVGSFLVSGEYSWRVIALDSRGRGAASPMRRFDYSTLTGTALIRTYQESGERLPRVMVDIEFAAGGVNIIPAITNESGCLDKELIPGEYVFLASKEDYVDTMAYTVIYPDSDRYVSIYMRRAPARVRGVVLDESDATVANARVVAESDEQSVEAWTDASGRFVIQATSGSWTVRAEKAGYAPSDAQAFDLSAGEYFELEDPLVLIGTPGIVTGSVLNADGRAIVGAMVLAQSSLGTFREFTDTNGHFASELAPTTWSVWAEKSGFQTSTPREVIVHAGENQSIDPPLMLLPVGSSIMGRVTDGSMDLAGATVIAIPPSGDVAVTTTNAFGEFLLIPPSSTYELEARYDGYGPSDPYQVSVEAGEAFTGIELAMAPLNSSIEGFVTADGEPVSGALVTDGYLETETGSDGFFRLELPSGGHTVRAIMEGYVSARPLFVATSPGQVLTDLDIQLAHGASTLSGRVLHEGSAVPRATVVCTKGGITSETLSDHAGQFNLFVEAGDWEIRATRDGFEPSALQTVSVAPGQSASGIALSLTARYATIKGSITDTRGAVRRASVFVNSVGGSAPTWRTSTSWNGMYTVRVLPGHAYELVVRAQEHGSASLSVAELDPGEVAIQNLALPAYDGSISGTIENPTGSPLDGVEVVASWGDSASAVTDHRGNYRLWVNDGLYSVRVGRAGYANAFFTGVEVVSGEPTELDARLQPVFATLEGTISDSLSGNPIANVVVTSRCSSGSASDVTDATGWYSLNSLVPGENVVNFGRTGYRSRSITMLFAEHESVEFDQSLFRLSGTIAGRVVESDGSTPVSRVSLHAKVGDLLISSATTNEEGFYALVHLDPEELYDIHASKTGYYPASQNPVTGVDPGTTGLDFTMLPSDGIISGMISDGTSAEHLSGVTLTADDGAGHFGATMSESDGSFVFDSLVPLESYTVVASLYGYREVVIDSVDVNGEDLEIEMPRNFARVLGTIYPDGEEVNIQEIEVVATNTAYAGEMKVTTPSESGVYEIIELRPGSYVLSTSSLGCIANPPQMTLNLGEGETATGHDFHIERATIDRVELSGDTQVEAGTTVSFSASAVADGGELVETNLGWWISPEEAGVMARGTGQFTASPGYFGEFMVGAREIESGATGSLAATVYVRIDPSTHGVFTDSLGMSIDIPEGSVTEAKSIYLSHEVLPNAKRYAREYEVSLPGYRLKPRGLSFEENHFPLLTLPSPTDDARMVRWNKALLEWDFVDANRVGNDIEAPMESLAEYATASRSVALGISDVSAEPNPFSPENGPVTISYILSSNEARMPFVTIRVFNMASQLVRQLVTNEPQGKGRACAEWDGLTDAGEKARNGRYVVEISAKDPTGTVRALATLVLVK